MLRFFWWVFSCRFFWIFVKILFRILFFIIMGCALLIYILFWHLFEIIWFLFFIFKTFLYLLLWGIFFAWLFYQIPIILLFLGLCIIWLVKVEFFGIVVLWRVLFLRRELCSSTPSEFFWNYIVFVVFSWFLFICYLKLFILLIFWAMIIYMLCLWLLTIILN